MPQKCVGRVQRYGGCPCRSRCHRSVRRRALRACEQGASAHFIGRTAEAVCRISEPGGGDDERIYRPGGKKLYLYRVPGSGYRRAFPGDFRRSVKDQYVGLQDLRDDSAAPDRCAGQGSVGGDQGTRRQPHRYEGYAPYAQQPCAGDEFRKLRGGRQHSGRGSVHLSEADRNRRRFTCSPDVFARYAVQRSGAAVSGWHDYQIYLQ